MAHALRLLGWLHGEDVPVWRMSVIGLAVALLAIAVLAAMHGERR